jgi:hypothetical protein
MPTQDAAQLIANRDELAAMSPEELEALAYPNEGDTNATPPSSNSESDKDTGKAAEQVEIDGAPIQTRDGKHVIPHSVLAAEREARAKAQAAAQEASTARAAAEARIAELQAQLDAAKANPEGSEAKDVEGIDEEFLAEMREDFPTIAKAYEAMHAQLEALKAQTSKQSQAQDQQVDQHKSEASRTVQDEIDRNPKLAHLQATDPDGWMQAVEIDQQLRSDPKTAHLPLAERFAKAAAVYEAKYGPINVQAQTTKASQQEDKPNVPLSMGQIPGGSPVPVDEAAALLSMDGRQATAHFSNMTKAQIEAALDRL